VSLEVAAGVVVGSIEQLIGFTSTTLMVSECLLTEELTDHEFDWTVEPEGCEATPLPTRTPNCDLRVNIFPNGEPIPSTTTLYMCSVDISAEAESGTYPLSCDDATVTDLDNRELLWRCIPGQIEVRPSPTPFAD
jgi:hypothetical protein